MPQRKRDPETRYRENIRKQERTLSEFAAHEIEWADDLLLWYRAKKMDMPDDEYRGVVFFKNREYLKKPGSLTLCYELYERINRELPPVTKETAFYQVAYRYKVYAAALMKGGYGGIDW